MVGYGRRIGISGVFSGTWRRLMDVLGRLRSGIGAGDRNRTYDLRITNAPLYQLSYSGSRTGLLEGAHSS
jgi:hypothetical protein